MLWYELENTDDIDSPALLIYPDRIRENIARAIEMVGDVERLQPHVKTVKMAEVVRMMQEQGIQRFKCSTIAEAEMLALESAREILFAMQPVGTNIRRFLSLMEKFPGINFSCLIDNSNIAAQISQAATERNLEVDFFIDLNVGMDRTGVMPGQAAEELFTVCRTLPGLSCKGLHAYDGHLRQPDAAQRKLNIIRAFEPVIRLRKKLEEITANPLRLVAGGSPGFYYHSTQPDRFCSPGTFLLWDAGYGENCPEQFFQPAALVLSRMVSAPASEKICLDLGHKSIASESSLNNRVRFLNAVEATPVSHSEEHLVLNNYAAQPGDLFYGIPWHICPTVALHEKALIVENHKITGTWDIVARKRKISL